MTILNAADTKWQYNSCGEFFSGSRLKWRQIFSINANSGTKFGPRFRIFFAKNNRFFTCRSRNCRFFLNLLLTNKFRKANRAKVSTPKGARKGYLAMTKPLVRSDMVASEAVRRPKQPRRICLKKSGVSVKLQSSHNEFQVQIRSFCDIAIFSQ